jgi:hypothetical protein
MARETFGAFGKIDRETAYGAVVAGMECGSYSSFRVIAGRWEDAWRAAFDRGRGDAFARVVIEDRYAAEELESEGVASEPVRRANLTDATIQRGFELLLQQHPKSYARIASGDGDALDGDALLQCAVLGKVIYG